MAYRIFVGSIQQETNSFSPAQSSLSDFDYAKEEQMLKKLSIEPLVRPDVELIPSIYAHAVPSGRMRREVFDALLSALLVKLDESADGVFLYLHGALDVEGIGSGDAEIVRAVRIRIGWHAPIAVAMDFHANVSPVLLENADVACAYRTAPHVDMEDTQRRACKLLMHMLTTGERPNGAMVRVPMLFTGDCVITENEPARTLMRKLEDMERSDPELMHLSLCFGQPWVDTEWVGTCVLAYARTRECALNAARALAQDWWDARMSFRFLVETAMPDQAFDMAFSGEKFPVFLSDSGDNTTAGAAGDRAGMLRRAIESGREGILIAGLTDALAVARCYEAGAGARQSLRVGGTLDKSHDEIVEGIFEIVHTGDILGWYGENAGRCAVVRMGGVTLMLTENRCAVTSPKILSSVGLSMEDFRVIVVKLGYLYPDLAAVAPRAIFVMTPGASTARVETIPYHRARRPVYPLDDVGNLNGEWAFVNHLHVEAQ